MLKLLAITLLLGDTGIPPASFWDGGAYVLNTKPIYVTLGDAGSGGGGGGAVTFWDAGVVVLNFPMPPASQAVTLWDGGVIVLNFPGIQAVSFWDAGVVVANFPATQTVTGTVAVSNFPASQPVTLWDGGVEVLNFPASQPVTLWDGGVEVLNFPASQTVSGTVAVSNFPASQVVTFWDAGVNVLQMWDAGVEVMNFPASQAVSFWDAGVNVLQMWDAGVEVLNTVNTSDSQSGNWGILIYYDGGGIPVTTTGLIIGDGGIQSVKIWDGTNTATVKGTSGTAVGTDSSLVVQLSPNQNNAAVVGVVGKVASGSATTNPIVVANTATVDGAAPATGTISAGRQAAMLGDVYGRQMVQVFHPNHWSCNLTNLTTLTQCQAAPGASTFLYVTDIIVSMGSTAGSITLSLGTGTNCGTTNVVFLGPHTLPINGLLITNPTTPFKGLANTELCASASNTAQVTISGFSAP